MRFQQTMPKSFFGCVLTWIFHLLFFGKTWSQQNFINVPSGEATITKKWFFQQQINYGNILQSNTTLEYGLKHGFEAGINVLGLNISKNKFSIIDNDSADTDPFSPLVLVNGLKQFNINKKFHLCIGTQAGGNFTTKTKEKPCALFYTNAVVKDWPLEKSSIVGGAYYNTLHYGGYGNRLGVWLGTELAVLPKLHITGETILGSNSLAYTSLGLIVYAQKRLPLTFGVQIPNNAKNTFGFVFELTWIPGE